MVKNYERRREENWRRTKPGPIGPTIGPPIQEGFSVRSGGEVDVTSDLQ